jgi:putative ABC transport system permease protein
VTALNRKLVRDLVHLRGQVAAIALVVASGVAIVVTSRTAYESLARSQITYYATYRFADIFDQLKRAPESLAKKIEAIPGVTAVRARIVFDVTVDVPGLAEPATGRLISIPERRVPMLNDLFIRRGRYVAPGRRDEVLISEAFAVANGLDVGATLGAILNGRWAKLQVVGIALSPEYIYEIRGVDIFPDNKRFGVMWMGRDAMEAAFDMEGAFNDVALSVDPEASEAEVLARLDHLLERYGGLGAFGRADQVSHRFLSDEIRQNRVFGTVMPAIFLGVAAFLLNIVLSRLVATQRDQIGVLKAFGYTHATVSLHYLLFALVAVAVGALLGASGGLWLGAKINRMYSEFYRFPIFRYDPSPMVIALAIGVSGVAALLGAAGAVRRAWVVPAAEAMRPEPPASFRAGILERLGAQRVLPPAARMIVRNLARRPLRAALSSLGVAWAVAILVLGRYFVDATEYLATVQFRFVQRDSMTVVGHEPLPGRARYAIADLPGVMRAEPFRVVPVRLRYAHRARRVALTGLVDGSGLRRLLDRRLRAVPLPPDGVVLTSKLADILRVGPGDILTVEVLEGSRPVRRVRVAGLVDELIGLSAYMRIDALNRLMREGRTVSGALLAVDPLAAPGLYAVLKRLPAIGGVMQREVALRSFEKTLGESIGIFTAVLVGFACVIAVAVVYNAARIALSERGHELASLRVLGFTRAEVAVMLLGEQAVVVLVAIPVGLLLGYGACALMASAYQWELFRLPLVVSRTTYVFALLVVSGAGVCSAWLVRRRLDRIDLVEVLKTRE